ncbi:MAG: hypothetical protein HGB15_08625 [Chlorobaculum sp.]|nr:hypothetical protein [Chlorobaculum sp.]
MADSVLFTGFPVKRDGREWKCKAMAGDELFNGSDFFRDALDTVITGQKASP